MPNRLAAETSPYLRQHADNPVDWYPWGAEALARAKAEDKPILLSVGYAACHWCHVMAHESFENADTAAVMNAGFVNIKVDREERPDIDAIYMQAVQALTGHGGWPMTMFLTPAGEPFYGGTYYPPDERNGLPSFVQILESVAVAYRDRRDSITKTVGAVAKIYESAAKRAASTGTVTAATLARAAHTIMGEYDPRDGGFGKAPKFPQAMAMDFLLRHWARTGDTNARDAVLATFRAMGRGGIFDQVGGGFARYATDARWLVPHFEKMLYDNALLARLGVQLWQATGDAEVRAVTEATLDWVRREMTAPHGGWYASLDADSDGHEGRFYVWTTAELDALLGDDARAAKAYWGVTPSGNFRDEAMHAAGAAAPAGNVEGQSILFVPDAPGAAAQRAGLALPELEAAVNRARDVLYDARLKRTWPARDEKIVGSWNGLMLRAMAEAARAFGRDDYRDAALAAGEFLVAHLVRDTGDGGLRALRVHAHSTSIITGFLEDHAALGLGFRALYELTFDPVWLDRAQAMAQACVRWFWHDATGAFFDTASDAEPLITRPRDITDSATPGGGSMATELLFVLDAARHTPEERRRAAWVLETLAEPMARHGLAFGHLLGAADLAVHGAVELAIVGDPEADDFRSLLREAAGTYVPSLVLAGGAPGAAGIALLADRVAVGGAATAYVCRGSVCDQPATTPAELHDRLVAARRSIVPSPSEFSVGHRGGA